MLLNELKNNFIDVQLVVKSQILAGGRGLGTFKSGLKGGVHIVKADQVEDIASMLPSIKYFIDSVISIYGCIVPFVCF